MIGETGPRSFHLVPVRQVLPSCPCFSHLRSDSQLTPTPLACLLMGKSLRKLPNLVPGTWGLTGIVNFCFILPLNCLLAPLPLPATVNKDMVFAFKSSQQKSARGAAWELFLSSQSQAGLRGISNLDAGFIEWSLEFLPHVIDTMKNFLYTLDWLQRWPQVYFTFHIPYITITVSTIKKWHLFLGLLNSGWFFSLLCLIKCTRRDGVIFRVYTKETWILQMFLLKLWDISENKPTLARWRWSFLRG